MELYVSINGDDSNSGTAAEPFATIAGARDAVRGLKKTTDEAITVHICGGTYYLSEPVVFTPDDSGTVDQPITYIADDTVTISGGVKLDLKWSPYKAGIMQAEIPAAKQGKLRFSQLFVNGKRQRRARYPNYNAENPLITGPGSLRHACMVSGQRGCDRP